MNRSGAQLVAGVALFMAYGWWLTAQPPFSAAGTVGVLVAGITLIALAQLWRRRASSDGTHSDRRYDTPERFWVWAVIIALLVAWELITLFSHPRQAHPTVSAITDPLQAEHVVRWLLYGGWLALGWSLAT